jgi:hypothetical protein
MDVLMEAGGAAYLHDVKVKMSERFALKFLEECDAAGIRIEIYSNSLVACLSPSSRLQIAVDRSLPGEMFQLRILKR